MPLSRILQRRRMLFRLYLFMHQFSIWFMPALIISLLLLFTSDYTIICAILLPFMLASFFGWIIAALRKGHTASNVKWLKRHGLLTCGDDIDISIPSDIPTGKVYFGQEAVFFGVRQQLLPYSEITSVGFGSVGYGLINLIFTMKDGKRFIALFKGAEDLRS